MFKNRVFLFLVLFVVACAFIGCGSPQVQPEDPNQKDPAVLDQENRSGEEGDQVDTDGNKPDSAEDNKTETETDAKVENKVVTGEYVGLIDNNSIEIEISEASGETSASAFALGEEIKDNFEERFELESGDKVRIKYIPRENQQPLIIEIEKIK